MRLQNAMAHDQLLVDLYDPGFYLLDTLESLLLSLRRSYWSVYAGRTIHAVSIPSVTRYLDHWDTPRTLVSLSRCFGATPKLLGSFTRHTYVGHHGGASNAENDIFIT
jgi:hypothetical protein